MAYDVNKDYAALNSSSMNYLNYSAGNNGLTGFQTWECYMLLKYGKQGQFGVAGDYEYLIELPLYPDDVTEQIAASWQPQKILGRSSPIAAYAGTDLKSASFNLDFHRDLLTGSFSHTRSSLDAIKSKLSNYYKNTIGGKDIQSLQAAGYQMQTDDGPFNTRDWYKAVNKLLQMSCYPQYTQQGLIPPTTYFIFGQMILKGFVQNYSTSWKKPIINSFYAWNTVQINMDCYPDTIMSARDFLKNASTQNTYNTEFPNVDTARSNVMDSRNGYTQANNSRNDSSLGGRLRTL